MTTTKQVFPSMGAGLSSFFWSIRSTSLLPLTARPRGRLVIDGGILCARLKSRGPPLAVADCAPIFKYMASGIPIPPDLIVPIRRSFLHDFPATSPSLSFPHHAQWGWNCCHMGHGKKAEDLEPGRCRRTDNKKLRCSKNTYPYSKYCERHMHWGRNRSRKPMEFYLAAKPNNSFSSSYTQMSPFSSNLSIPATEPCHLLCPNSNSAVISHFPFDAANFSNGEYMCIFIIFMFIFFFFSAQYATVFLGMLHTFSANSALGAHASVFQRSGHCLHAFSANSF